ncbi:MAG TPA: hypothetical protein VN701_00765, partial [Candidatus Paceibacterota bacterium]|nr:hypothetical protein [Candidatus Paceibacterota bacterium]
AGSVYIFGGQVMLWSPAIGITVYYAMLPLSLLAVDFFSKTGKLYLKIPLAACLGVLFGFGWLSGHLQFLVYVYLAAAAYWLYLLFTGRGSLKKQFVDFALLVGAVILSAAVGFPQIWAVLDFLPVTVRSSLPLSSAFHYSYHFQDAINLLIPSFKVPYVPLARSFPNYIGVIPLIIAAFGAANWKKVRSTPNFYFFAGMFLFCLCASVAYSPIAAAMHYLPVFHEFEETVRIMFVGDFALGICIALCAQKLLEDGLFSAPSRLWKWLGRFFWWIVVPGAALATITYAFFLEKIDSLAAKYFVSHIYPHTTGALPLSHYLSLLNQEVTRFVWQFSFLNAEVASLAIFGLAGYVLLRRLPGLPERARWMLMIAAVALNFAAVYANYIESIPKQELLSQPDTALAIKADMAKRGLDTGIASPLSGIALYNESVRCELPDIGNWNMDPQTFEIHKNLLDPNMFLYYGLGSLDGYEPYMTKEMANMTSYFNSSFTLKDGEYGVGNEANSLDDKFSEVLKRENAYRAFNVGYFLSLIPLSDPSLTQIYHSAIGACGTPIYIYALTDPWPRYFLTNRVIEATTTDFLGIMNQLNSVGAPSIILEASSTVPAQNPFMAAVASDSGDGLSFKVDAPADSYLFIGNEWLPGYTATIDGAPAPILKANYAMMAVRVPKGSHAVALSYTAVPPNVFSFVWAELRKKL